MINIDLPKSPVNGMVIELPKPLWEIIKTMTDCSSIKEMTVKDVSMIEDVELDFDAVQLIIKELMETPPKDDFRGVVAPLIAGLLMQSSRVSINKRLAEIGDKQITKLEKHIKMYDKLCTDALAYLDHNNPETSRMLKRQIDILEQFGGTLDEANTEWAAITTTMQ